MGAVLDKLRDVFFSSKMEIVLVGLENSGKTTFVNYLNVGRHLEEAPTVGMNVKVMKKGGVTLKVWDIGGQKQYRSEWARYTRGCNVIAFVVDTQTPQTLHIAKKELHQLLEDRELAVNHTQQHILTPTRTVSHWHMRGADLWCAVCAWYVLCCVVLACVVLSSEAAAARVG
jgi:GTPase SAR1 family protein